MDSWTEIPLDAEMFQNLDESVLRKSPRTLENAFINEAKGHSRFPGLRSWITLDGGGKVYLNEWDGNLIAVTDHGRIFRIDQDGNAEDVTGVVPVGMGRIIFASTNDELTFCAGGPIVKLQANKTEILSENAPLSTHVAYLSGFLLAIEMDSNRFFHCAAGDFTNWDPIDFFAAESSPDNLTALVVTEFGEAILAGPASIEQFEPYPGGDKSFFRRWSVGKGLIAPYTLVADDNGVWGISSLHEFSMYRGQNARAESLTMSKVLEKITDFTGAWAALMHLFGQKFIIVKIPNATNEYGSLGVTLLHDYKARRWSFIYGWDETLGLPANWPGNSYYNLFGQHFIGGLNGEIYKLDDVLYENGGVRQQMFWRSAHMDHMGKTQINKLRMRLKRGAPESTYANNFDFQLRTRRDKREWSKWQTRKLGFSGDGDMYVQWGAQGSALTWQFEYRCGAPVPVEVVRMEVVAERVD